MTANDTGILGSGTKAYTSAAVMRLVDQGKVKLADPAYQYVDVPLKRIWNTTIYELFGHWANDITIHNLLFMQSGLQDYEVGRFDQDLLLPNSSHLVHEPIEILKYVGSLPD